MNLLIIEDDKILSNTIKQCVKDKFNVEQAFDGEEGVLYAREKIYDIIICDIMMPELNGYEVLATLRKEKIFTPVLILTAKDSLDDKLKGFNSGADDYLVKPFEREELIARIEAIVRRANKSYFENTLAFKGLVLNLENRAVTIEGEEVFLQGKQFDLLEYLIKAKNTIITKDQIFNKIWGFDSMTSSNVVEVYSSELRKTLKKFNYDKYMKTVRGVGYMWSDK